MEGNYLIVVALLLQELKITIQIANYSMVGHPSKNYPGFIDWMRSKVVSFSDTRVPVEGIANIPGYSTDTSSENEQSHTCQELILAMMDKPLAFQSGTTN